MPSGLPFSTSTTGPYHQAGRVKLITLTRSGLTWMFCAITSVRPDSSAGICNSQGIHSMRPLLDPQPVEHGVVDLDVDAARLLGVGIEDRMRRDRRFAEHDALLAHPLKRAVGAVLELRLGLLKELLRLRGGSRRRRTRRRGRPDQRSDNAWAILLCRPAPDRLTLSQMRVGLLLPAPRQARTRYFSTTAMSGSTPSPGSSGTRM